MFKTKLFALSTLAAFLGSVSVVAFADPSVPPTTNQNQQQVAPNAGQNEKNLDPTYVDVTNNMQELHYSGPKAGKFIPLILHVSYIKDAVVKRVNGEVEKGVKNREIILNYGDRARVWPVSDAKDYYGNPLPPQVSYQAYTVEGQPLYGWMNGTISYIGIDLPISVKITNSTSGFDEQYKMENPAWIMKGFLTPIKSEPFNA